VLLIRTGEAGASSARMATWLSESEMSTTLSTGLSWQASLAARSNGGSTSITAIANALTTDPRTLNFSRWLNMHGTITPAESSPVGCSCDAWPVAETSSGDGVKWSGTHVRTAPVNASAQGRWPKNVVLSHDESCSDGSCVESCPVRLLDEQSGEASFNPKGAFGTAKRDAGRLYGGGKGLPHAGQDVFGYGDSGGASRFFYTAKSSSAERSAGLGGVQEGADRNSHPT
jgi:hypothetical protein